MDKTRNHFKPEGDLEDILERCEDDVSANACSDWIFDGNIWYCNTCFLADVIFDNFVDIKLCLWYYITV